MGLPRQSKADSWNSSKDKKMASSSRRSQKNVILNKLKNHNVINLKQSYSNVFGLCIEAWAVLLGFEVVVPVYFCLRI